MKGDPCRCCKLLQKDACPGKMNCKKKAKYLQELREYRKYKRIHKIQEENHIEVIDPEAPYGRKVDGTPAKKRGHPTGVPRAPGERRTSEIYSLPEGVNTKYLTYTQNCMEIALTADINNPDTLLDCFYRYIQCCATNDVHIGNLGAYAAMGISSSLASAWKNKQKHANDPRYAELIELVNRVCAAYREQVTMGGDLNVVWAIFAGKNFDGMKDVNDYVAPPSNPLGERKTPAQLQAEYGDIKTEDE